MSSSYALRPLGGNPESSPDSARRLSTIVEDGDHSQSQVRPPGMAALSPPPRNPARIFHRPSNRRFWHGEPPKHSHDVPPPPYTLPGSVPDTSDADREKLIALRNRKFLVRRGGWKRVGLCVILLLAIIVALTVGLVLGLRNLRNAQNGTTSSTSSSSSSSSSSNNQTYPAGSYSIPAYLNTVSTDCTSNAATWNCYPSSVTYNSTHNGSSVTFDWTITLLPPTSNNAPPDLRISTAENPFTVQFANLSLTLDDSGLATERYSFNTTMPLTVIPSSPITTDGRATSCTFPSAMLTGRLFTKMAPKLNLADHTSSSSGAGTVAWPGQVEFEIKQAGGSGVPDCHYAVGAQVLGAVGQQPVPVGTDRSCGCFYEA